AESKVLVVRELVRINHHHNCLLCHMPAASASIGGLVPTPGESLPPLFDSTYYWQAPSGSIFVRADITYLRQDFSLMLPVADAEKPRWPSRQRFDFLVRTCTLTPGEIAHFARLRSAEKSQPSEYRRALLHALYMTTGKYFGTTAQQWRQGLGYRTISKD